MPAFTSTPAPVHTLWDIPDTAIQRLPGIWFVTTPLAWWLRPVG
ncbi:hypothetical protein NHF48_000475 [Sphingomonas sp. H160509]|nr:hypothetical protein [Sphingomonas sp. H160509]MDD1449734.1 hypothetical protein [Sphingomonas sp. H160509]